MDYSKNEREDSSYQEEVLRAQLEIQEHSLNLIIKEIYDNIGQVLSLAKLNLHSLEKLQDNEVKKVIADSDKLVSKAIRDLRTITRSITVKEILRNGFIYALEKETETLNRTDTCRVNLKWNENFPRFEVSKELILFRIAQELTSIVLDSSLKKEVLINAGYADTVATISIKNCPDKNEGLSYPDKARAAIASYSKSMHFRAQLVYADITTMHIPGEGIEVIIKLPI